MNILKIAIVIFYLICYMTCSSRKQTAMRGGVDVSVFSKALALEKAAGLKQLEIGESSEIRIYKLETMGADIHANDYLVHLEISSKKTAISIWKIKNGNIAQTKKAWLEGKDISNFFRKMKETRPQFLNSLTCSDLLDGKGHFVFRFKYFHFNQFYFHDIDEFKSSPHNEFLEYMRSIIKAKLDMEI